MSVGRTKSLELIRKSAKRLEFRIEKLPPGTTLVSAKWMLKASAGDPDGSALISKSVTLSAGPSGHVEDAGASGTAKVAIQIGSADLDAVVQNAGISSLKIITSTGLASEISETRLPVTILPAVITGT